MTHEELKAAFFSGHRVEHNGIVYDHISALIYRKGDGGTLAATAELMDKTGRSVTIAEPRRIKEVIENENEIKQDSKAEA